MPSLRRRSILCLAVAGAALLAAAPDPLRQAVDNPARDAGQVARDQYRHPYDELRFLGLTPASRVVEIWPGGKPYWTPILAPYLKAGGAYTLALPDPAKPPALLAGDPAAYGQVKVTQFSPSHPEPAPAGSADLVVTFRNLHNWVGDGSAPAMLAGIHRALKPGGILGIEDHRARPDRPQDPKAADGYLRQDYAVALVEKAGFKLVGASELLANPRDTTHWPKGVWTLPPTYAAGEADRAKYQAIGEADNFLLKFRKVG